MKQYSLATKPHYPILDGLRGVAALIVVAFHLMETHSTSHLDQVINHGYLAVDFFFVLSGFVIGYAYDDRWSKMTTGRFFKTRLVRLQPMVIMGMIIGAILFYTQASPVWPQIGTTPVWKMLLVMLVGFTMIPILPSMDIRGWNESYPLNGPAWSLFYEYVVNILYALFIRRFSKTLLSILVLLAAFALVQYAVTSPTGDVIGGWSLEPLQLRIGFTRVMYPFFAGLLLFRIGKLAQLRHAFWWCSVLLALVLAIPRIGGSDHLWMNGLYDSLTILFVFPLIVFMGASGNLHNKASQRICKFLGDISYPIYITHYPLIYWYTGWVAKTQTPLWKAWPITLLVFVAALGIAYASLKFYDEPVRLWLKQKFLVKGKKTFANENPVAVNEQTR